MDLKGKKVELSKSQVKEQLGYVQKYLALIEKELGYGDLVNVENVTKYTEVVKHHSRLAKQGYVIL